MEEHFLETENVKYRQRKATLIVIIGGIFGLLGIGLIYLKKRELGITFSILTFSFYIFTALLGFAIAGTSQFVRFYSSFIPSYQEAINIFIILSIVYGAVWVLFIIYTRRISNKHDLQPINHKRKSRVVNFFSGRNGPLIFMAILPAAAITFMMFMEEIAVLSNFPYYLYYLPSFIFVISVFFVVLGLYVPYPMAYSTASFFKRMGYKNVITEYEYIKKILYIVFPSCVLVAICLYVINLMTASAVLNMLENQTSIQSISDFLEPILMDEQLDEKLTILQVGIVLMLFSGTIRIAIMLFRDDFRLCYSEASFAIAAAERDDVQKVTYLVSGLKAYNAYLKRHLKLEIKNMKKMISKVSSVDKEEKAKLINSISESFLISELEPLNRLSLYFEVSEPQELLSKQSKIDRLKERTQELVAATTGLITVIVSINTILTDEGTKKLTQSFFNSAGNFTNVTTPEFNITAAESKNATEVVQAIAGLLFNIQ